MDGDGPFKWRIVTGTTLLSFLVFALLVTLSVPPGFGTLGHWGVASAVNLGAFALAGVALYTRA